MKKINIESKYGSFVVLVDDDDYEILNNYIWHVDFNKNKTIVYARNNQLGRMHRYIFELYNINTDKLFVDHIDGNGLNNQKSNLRLVTSDTNARNNYKVRAGKYIGVGYREHAKRYIAKIKSNKKDISLGYFDTPEEAAYAYDMAAILFFNEIRALNFPEKCPEYFDRIKNNDFPFNQKRKTSRVSPTQYRGVAISRGRNHKFSGYSSNISINSKRIFLGYYKEPEIAARVYDLARYIKNNRNIDQQLMNFPDDFHSYWSEQDIISMEELIYSKTN